MALAPELDLAAATAAAPALAVALALAVVGDSAAVKVLAVHAREHRGKPSSSA